MRVPKGQPVHENLSTSYVDVGALLADLQVNGFTGYVAVGLHGYDACVFIDAGSIIGAIEETDTATRTGTEAINGLLVRAENPGGNVSFFRHSSATVQAIAGIIEGQIIYQNLSSEFTDLNKLVNALRRDEGTIWYVEVVVAGDRGSGVIYVSGGDIDGVYSPSSGETVAGASALAAMVDTAEAVGAVFNVFSVSAAIDMPSADRSVGAPRLSVVAPAEPPETELAAAPEVDDIAPLVLLMSEVIAAVERAVSSLDNAPNFAIELRAAQLEVADHFPFLDPFAAEFEYHAGEIVFVGTASSEEFAAGLGETLHVAVLALTRREGPGGERARRRIADALANLYEARQDEFDAYGLAGLMAYIVDPETAGAAGAGDPA